MSFFYKFDARSKLFFIILITFLVFIVDKLSVAVCLLLSVFIIRLTAKIPFRILKLLKNLTLLAAFIILMQSFFGPGDNYILKPIFPYSFPVLGGLGHIKKEGFFLGLVIICRLTTLMILLPVFTETTPPEKIASGLCALGFNYRISFIITTAFNLIPFFKETALIIMDSQKLRGLRSAGIKAFAGLLFPLMLSAMKKAQVSSIAMDCRAFGIYKTRTWTNKPQMKTPDFYFIICSIVFFGCIIFFNYI
ncbi:MAG: energy-coupling factor transporter transmembrane protein EcfT [Treponema sp.]|nr:energy-coupling factor transporter transmembrane protein EcfT [Treponema sp.]